MWYQKQQQQLQQQQHERKQKNNFKFKFKSEYVNLKIVNNKKQDEESMLFAN